MNDPDHRPWSIARALLWGTLAVGVLDIASAFVFYGLRGATPVRILQAVASGLLGREAAVGGGLATAALGGALHFFIAFGVAATYLAASRRLPPLTRHAVACGLAYGLAVYGFMQLVVLPLADLSPAPKTAPFLLFGLLGHAALVGLPAALAARRAAPANG